MEALHRHGLLKGLYLTFARILRCQPWAAWGDDPVPEKFSFTPWRVEADPVSLPDRAAGRIAGEHGSCGVSQTACRALRLRGSE